MEEMDRLFAAIDRSRDEVIRLQGELTSRVALGPANGGTGEHAKAAYLEEEINRLEPDAFETVRAPDPEAEGGYRPNLVARWEGPAGEPRVWVLSHMDVVPAGDPNLWEGDPYRLRVEGDRLFGRGVEDDQHAIVSSLLAVEALRSTGVELARPVGLVLVADEETGSRCGLGHLLAHRPDLFSPRDLIVVPDAGNEEGTMIEVAEKSVMWLRFTVKGRACHASTPQKGRNSLYGAARLITALEELKSRFDETDPLFHPSGSTFVPTRIEANVPNVNTAPGKDVFHMDCRVLPRVPLASAVAAAREIAAGVAGELGLEVDVEVEYSAEAADPTPADAPVVKALQRAVRRVNGREARPAGIGGGTVAALFRKAGLPAAVWMTARDTAHQANEYCLVPDVLQDAKVFACLFAAGDVSHQTQQLKTQLDVGND
jgi:succinyl-diaminopimelate desuccinylase